MTTPMRRQYLELKQQHPDTLLLFRLGDFYETFDEDARVLARVCDVALTSRPVGHNQRVPLAGVPYHSLDTYLGKLMAAGLKVAIAEQMSEPGKGLVEREITQVMTRGTVTSPDLLTHAQNVLAAVNLDTRHRTAGIAHCDLTEGHLAATELTASTQAELEMQVADELMRLEPNEILLSPRLRTEHPDLDQALQRMGYVISELEPWIWAAARATRQVQEQFRVQTLEGFGLAQKPAAVCALGGLLHYVQSYQPLIVPHLDRIQTYAVADFMHLDEFTRLNLELTENLRTRTLEGSLLEILDRTLTPMGGRRLRHWLGQPLLDIQAIDRRLDAVAQLYDAGMELRTLREGLAQIGDLSRWVQRIRYGTALPRDLAGIRNTLALVPDLMARWTTAESGPVTELLRTLPCCTDIRELLNKALVENPPATLSQGGIIRSGFDAELDKLVTQTEDAKTRLSQMEQTERERLDIPSLKVGYNKVFGYFLEVPRTQSRKVPSDYIRKQTLVKAERYFTEELKSYESLILNADQRQLELEQELFQSLCTELRTCHQDDLQRLANQLADLDVYAALADCAVANNYVRPHMTDDFALYIEEGRHPVVEATTLLDTAFIPNNVHMEADNALQILTGPNMSGKSTFLRQVALIVLMAQMGSYVPARTATIGVVDRIFTRIGASDAIQRGLSTFMVEMVETANILHHASSRSLLILDEIGRGTSTYDGLAIAWAVLEYIHNAEHLGAKTLFATHFHELTDLAERLPRVQNYHVTVDDTGETIAFLHTISTGRAERSFGVQVGRMAGLPQAVVERADQILSQLEASGAAVPASLGDVIPETQPEQAVQPTLYLEEHPAIAALKSLQVDGITPLDAMNKLYELIKLAEE